MDNRTKDQGSNILAYLAATAPALFQLIAVLSVGLSNILNLSKLVFLPEFLNLANLFVVLFTLTLITASSYWDYNKFNFDFKKDKTIDFWKYPKIFWSFFKKVVILSLIFGLIFIVIILNKETLSNNYYIWVTIQWLSYIVSMTLISYSIYVFSLLKIQERNVKLMQENFVPKLMDSLRRYGYVRNPDIKIQMIDRNSLQAIVVIDKVIYRIGTSVEGEMLSAAELKPAV